MKIVARAAGSLRKSLVRLSARVTAASTEAMGKAGEGLKRDLRSQVVRAGLGNRLAKAWRSRLYPNTPGDPAALVWSKAPKLIRVFDEGATIRSRRGLWLTIPTDAARRVAGGRRRRRHLTPGAVEQVLGQPLRFVYRRGRPSLLVAANVRITAKSGRIRSAVRRRRDGSSYTQLAGRTQVVMFVLVPKVRLAKRLDVAGAARTWTRRLPKLIRESRR